MNFVKPFNSSLKNFFLYSFIIISLLFFTQNFVLVSCFADTNYDLKEIFCVYNENNELIFESTFIEVGDKIIDKNLNEYEITGIDYQTHSAKAELNGRYIKPKILKNSKSLNFSNKSVEKSVGLYMSHNDESFTPTDGYYTIYGPGGIHDVARELGKAFLSLDYTVYLDETLHLPHDSKAYTRSAETAKSLCDKNVDALFDIHRDAVARSVYVKNIDGVERCKVRIVVGQANPNKDANLQFAMYLMSVAEEYCPWLFLDIYYAKGHYNQALTSKGLLFEMGTYLAEKEKVIETAPFLAKIVDKTLFSTVVEEDNSLTITDSPTEEQTLNIVNNVLNEQSKNYFDSKYIANITIFSIVFISIMALIILGAILRKKHLKLSR